MKKEKTSKKLLNKIKEYENIIIAKHTRPDWDAQGSAMGLAYIIDQNFKNKKIYVVGNRLDDNQDFLPDNKLTEEFIRKSLLITVDTANLARVDFDKEKINQAKEIFKIDHHIPVENYGTNNMVDEFASACTQVVSLWAKKMKLKINSKAGENLYKGLLTDSGRFLFQSVNEQTFETAMFLLESGFDLQKVYNQLYVSKLKIRQWLNYAFSKMEITKNGVAYIILQKQDYDKYDLTYEEIKAALSTMSGIEEIKIWFTVIDIENELKVSLRSRQFNVNSVAIKYNGGGHKLASGATLKKLDDYKKLVKDLDNLIVGKQKHDDEK